MTDHRTNDDSDYGEFRPVEAGDVLDGRYRIVRPLGHGGMGTVFEAFDAEVGDSVAIKVMRTHASHRIHRGRFLREARIEGALSHPNIITVRAFGETDEGRIYIVTELLVGETVGDAIHRRTTLPSEDAVYIAVEVLKALEAAHTAEVVHRDLKPDNIFITRDGRIKVLDFGMVKLLNREDSIGPLTRTGTIGGTPQYISPEMAQGQAVDGRTDLYALGIILYEMLSGQPPYDAVAPVEVLLKHIKDPLPGLEAPRNDVPETLVAVIEGVLAKTPTGRPSSAQALRQSLEAIAADLPVPALTRRGGEVREAESHPTATIVMPNLRDEHGPTIVMSSIVDTEDEMDSKPQASGLFADTIDEATDDDWLEDTRTTDPVDVVVALEPDSAASRPSAHHDTEPDLVADDSAPIAPITTAEAEGPSHSVEPSPPISPLAWVVLAVLLGWVAYGLLAG